MNSSIFYGVGMAALIALNAQLTFDPLPSEQAGSLLAPLLVLAVVFFMVFMGIRGERNRAGGLSFAAAMKRGLAIGAVGGVLTGAYFWYYFSIVNPQFTPALLAQQEARFLADSLAAGEIESRLAVLQRQFSPGGQFFSNMASVLFFSLIFSILSSFLLTRGFREIADRPRDTDA